MKKVVLIFIALIAGSLTAFSQTVKYITVKDKELTYVLNNIRKTTHIDYSKDLFIHVFDVTDPSGSAHVDGGDEVTDSIYITTSESGEAPEQHLFRLTSLYAPALKGWKKTTAGPELIIVYGPKSQQATIGVTVSLRKLVIRQISTRKK